MDPNTNICNLALGNLGITDLITSVMNDGTLEAQQCNLHWTAVYLEVLRSHPWRFATARWNLGGASDTDQPEFGWANAFKLPGECRRIISVHGADGRKLDRAESWARECNCILTNEDGPLYLKGLRAICDISRLDPLFVTAMAFRLAAAIASGMGEGAQMADMMSAYSQTVASARSIDSSEAAPPRRQSGAWATAYRR